MFINRHLPKEHTTMVENRLKSNVKSLVLDAGPLITQPAAQLQLLAETFYTTPGVYNELKDESVRNQLIIWGNKLQVRHPKKDAIQAVVDFARLTGDSTVLSQNDLHIIALAYEIDTDLNNGIPRFRKFPGEIREEDAKRIAEERKKWEERRLKESEAQKINEVESNQIVEDVKQVDDDGFEVVVNKKKTRKQIKEEQKARAAEEELALKCKEEELARGEDKELLADFPGQLTSEANDDNLEEEYSNDDDDGEWITPDNLGATMAKDDLVQTVEADTPETAQINCALATGDFAAQNVALQMGMNLMNTMSGLQIKRVRNYMLRCHACFTLIPIPRDNTPKHFCPSCGGATLRRIPVSVNSYTGKITPHLAKNFQWRTRGNVFSVASPLSKSTAKKYGNKGFQHGKTSKMDGNFFSEDQHEYQQAIKDAKWQQRQNEKSLEDFIGGGSADNCISPFFTGANVKPVNVKVGKGRFANQARKKR